MLRTSVVSISAVDASWIVHEAGRQDVEFEIVLRPNPTALLAIMLHAASVASTAPGFEAHRRVASECFEQAMRTSPASADPYDAVARVYEARGVFGAAMPFREECGRIVNR